jgi:hypothetical protein
MSASAQQRLAQYDRIRDQLVESPSARGKLVMAILLCLPDTPFVDFKRARTLVSDFLRSGSEHSAEDLGLAELMRVLLAENERKQNELGRLGTQIEQLKEIEKDITHTEQSVNVPTPPPTEDERKEKDTPGR